MFTGIITDIGTLIALEEAPGLRRLRIAARYDSASIALGASIACAGVCLTVTARGTIHGQGANPAQNWFEVEAAAETLALTKVGAWRIGTRINLERAMRAGDEFGGHIVSGHVDGLVKTVSREEVTHAQDSWGPSVRFTFVAPAPLHRLIAQKGSVALDGVSLTVNTVEGNAFSVLLIPHTVAHTTFAALENGADVHLEVDMLARYAARLAQTA